jgi:hypothetical protein
VATRDLLEPHLNRKVRVVAKESGPHVQQLFDEAAGDRYEWDVDDWMIVLKSVDSCELSVAEWRTVNDLI